MYGYARPQRYKEQHNDLQRQVCYRGTSFWQIYSSANQYFFPIELTAALILNYLVTTCRVRCRREWSVLGRRSGDGHCLLPPLHFRLKNGTSRAKSKQNFLVDEITFFQYSLTTLQIGRLSVTKLLRLGLNSNGWAEWVTNRHRRTIFVK
jgi:hypothetical protein